MILTSVKLLLDEIFPTANPTHLYPKSTHANFEENLMNGWIDRHGKVKEVQHTSSVFKLGFKNIFQLQNENF